MKKKLLFLGILMFAFISCEDDDFCYQDTTPRLIFGFYDKDSPTTKKAVPVYVWADKKDSIYQLATVDSILVPLNTKSTSTLYKIAYTNIVDEFNFSYTISDKFVSESCGYIAIFNDFSMTSHTQNWIESVDIVVTKIENETETHVKVYH